MKLDINCVRDVLLALEKNTTTSFTSFSELPSMLPNYEPDQIAYTCLKLSEAGFIDIVIKNVSVNSLPKVVKIRDITYAGHEFLNTIRNNNIWDKVKTTAKKAGVYSLKAITEIGIQVAAVAIQAAHQQSPQ